MATRALLVVYVLTACVPQQSFGMPPYVMSIPVPETPPSPTASMAPTAVQIEAAASLHSPSPTTIIPDDAWEGLGKRALLAGRLVLYSDTARTLTSLTNMLGAYPGLDAVGRVMSGAELCATVTRESEDDNATADLVLTSGTACIQRLARAGYLVPYVPTSLRPFMREDMLAPVLTHHWEVVGIHHNGRADPEDALASWWDLVGPAWRGRVALADPLIDDHALGLLEALIAHDDALRASYQGQLGADALEDEPAWSVWLRALLANDVVLLPSDAEVARWIGEPAAQEPRAGFCSSVHWERVLRGELNLEFAIRAVPAAGVRWRTYVAPTAHASNPDGARLALAWLLGDPSGGGGYEPWYQAGIYPSRLDVPLPAGSVPRGELAGRLWEVPSEPDEAFRGAVIEAFAAARDE